MSIPVICTFVLQSSDDGESSSGPPTPSSYPDRIINFVPNSMAPLVSAMADPHSVDSSAVADYAAEADSIVKNALGGNWGVDLTPYVSGSIENNGSWEPASGYAFQIQQGTSDLEDPLPGVAPSCVCRYLIAMRPAL